MKGEKVCQKGADWKVASKVPLVKVPAPCTVSPGRVAVKVWTEVVKRFLGSKLRAAESAGEQVMLRPL